MRENRHPEEKQPDSNPATTEACLQPITIPKDCLNDGVIKLFIGELEQANNQEQHLSISNEIKERINSLLREKRKCDDAIDQYNLTLNSQQGKIKVLQTYPGCSLPAKITPPNIRPIFEENKDFVTGYKVATEYITSITNRLSKQNLEVDKQIRQHEKKAEKSYSRKEAIYTALQQTVCAKFEESVANNILTIHRYTQDPAKTTIENLAKLERTIKALEKDITKQESTEAEKIINKINKAVEEINKIKKEAPKQYKDYDEKIRRYNEKNSERKEKKPSSPLQLTEDQDIAFFHSIHKLKDIPTVEPLNNIGIAKERSLERDTEIKRLEDKLMILSDYQEILPFLDLKAPSLLTDIKEYLRSAPKTVEHQIRRYKLARKLLAHKKNPGLLYEAIPFIVKDMEIGTIQQYKNLIHDSEGREVREETRRPARLIINYILDETTRQNGCTELNVSFICDLLKEDVSYENIEKLTKKTGIASRLQYLTKEQKNVITTILKENRDQRKLETLLEAVKNIINYNSDDQKYFSAQNGLKACMDSASVMKLILDTYSLTDLLNKPKSKNKVLIAALLKKHAPMEYESTYKLSDPQKSSIKLLLSAQGELEKQATLVTEIKKEGTNLNKAIQNERNEAKPAESDTNKELLAYYQNRIQSQPHSSTLQEKINKLKALENNFTKENQKLIALTNLHEDKTKLIVALSKFSETYGNSNETRDNLNQFVTEKAISAILSSRSKEEIVSKVQSAANQYFKHDNMGWRIAADIMQIVTGLIVVRWGARWASRKLFSCCYRSDSKSSPLLFSSQPTAYEEKILNVAKDEFKPAAGR